jgi:hypothetical protein
MGRPAARRRASGRKAGEQASGRAGTGASGGGVIPDLERNNYQEMVQEGCTMGKFCLINSKDLAFRVAIIAELSRGSVKNTQRFTSLEIDV